MSSFIKDLTRKVPPLLPYVPPPLSTYAPKPKPAGSHQLGKVKLPNIYQLTSTSADEIEKAADQLVLTAQETAELLRNAARRLRESGIYANERISNFVKVANACADAAKIMQRSVARRDEPPPSVIARPALEASIIESENDK